MEYSHLVVHQETADKVRKIASESGLTIIELIAKWCDESKDVVSVPVEPSPPTEEERAAYKSAKESKIRTTVSIDASTLALLDVLSRHTGLSKSALIHSIAVKYVNAWTKGESQIDLA